MNYKIIQCCDLSWIIVDNLKNNEIARLEAKKIANYVQVDMFGVKENYRKQGLGKSLINLLIATIKNNPSMSNVKKIVVFRQSTVVYVGDALLDDSELEKIYTALHFIEVSGKTSGIKKWKDSYDLCNFCAD